MKPKIAKTLMGKMVIKYRCPKCEDKLVSPLDEAGAEDTCPVCSTNFVVPGQAEKAELEKRQEADLDIRLSLLIDSNPDDDPPLPPFPKPSQFPPTNIDTPLPSAFEQGQKPLTPTFELTLKPVRAGKFDSKKIIVAAETEAEARGIAEKDGGTVISVAPYNFWIAECTVAGVSYKNRDNTSRYKVIRSCEPGDSITLEHESGNRNDKNAIRVLDASGRQMGHLPREKAATVMLWYREGYSPVYSAIVENVERWDGGGVPHLRLVVKQPSAREDKIIAVLREAGVENPADYLPRKTLYSKPVFKFGPKNPKPKPGGDHQRTKSGCAVLLTLASILCGVALWCVDCIAS